MQTFKRNIHKSILTFLLGIVSLFVFGKNISLEFNKLENNIVEKKSNNFQNLFKSEKSRFKSIKDENFIEEVEETDELEDSESHIFLDSYLNFNSSTLLNITFKTKLNVNNYHNQYSFLNKVPLYLMFCNFKYDIA